MLQEVDEAQREPEYVVLDELFNDASNGDEPTTGDRKLQTAAFGVTEEMCNAYKKNFIFIVLSLLADVDTECVNLMLSPNRMECILIL
jgi:hypothetical protein